MLQKHFALPIISPALSITVSSLLIKARGLNLPVLGVILSLACACVAHRFSMKRIISFRVATGSIHMAKGGWTVVKNRKGLVDHLSD